MSSAAQVLANRQNAQRSTGPTSPDGKAASSKNATRHGLSGAFALLPNEAQDDFDQLAARIRGEFQPEGDKETFLVGQMIQARWRLLRVERFEAAAFEQILTEPGATADPDACIVAAISKSGNPLDKLQRYSAAAERSYYKALRELQTSRAHTHQGEAKALDNSISKFIFAPVPGELERKSYHAAVNAHVQNEANRTNAPQPAQSAKSVSNPALRL